MDIAVLVLAFKEPEVLRRAVRAYDAAGFRVFVHLDAKADINRYSSALGDDLSSCTFIEARHSIFWGGFSMVEAELALISAAMATAHFDRFSLVSDDALPVIPPARLRSLVEKNHDRIALRKLSATDPFMARYRGFFFFDHPASSLHGRPIETATIDENFLEHMDAVKRLKSVGKAEIDIYYGSQWWTLTRESIDTILGALRESPRILESFRYSAVPDEIMVQSLIGNFSPLSRVRDTPMFVDWSRNPRPYVFREPSEYSAVKPDHGWVRKFSSRMPKAYEGLIDLMDEASKY